MTAKDRSPRRVLAVAQTHGELRWACSQAALQGKGARWTVLVIGDAEAGEGLAGEPGYCGFLHLDDLKADAEGVWREARRLQASLWDAGALPPWRLLHLTTQRYVVRLLIRLLYQEAVVERALDAAEAEEVRIPPPWASRCGRPSPQALPELQDIVRGIARRRGVRCVTPWAARLWSFAEPLLSWLRQSSYLLLLIGWDAARVAHWASQKAWGAARALAGRGGEAGVPPGAILLANADWELRRHFDVGALSPRLAERCYVWSFVPQALVPFGDRRWLERAEARGLRKAPQGVLSFFALPPGAGCRGRFPTMVTPLVLRNSGMWYNSAWPSWRGPGAAERALSLYASLSLARERLVHWRRIVYAARSYALGRDLFRAVRPALLVVSDDIVYSAMTLAARECGVASLMTPQGVVLWNEGYADVYPLADVTCLFRGTHVFVADKAYPGLPTRRIVCHDHRLEAEAGPAKPPRERAPGRRRVMIVTSRYFADWSEELLVRRRSFHRLLGELVDRLAALPDPPEVVFKPHPTQESHEPYQELAARHPRVVGGIWGDPLLSSDQGLRTDVMVIFNCSSTVMFYAFRRSIPVVSHWGALTSRGRSLYPISELLGSDKGDEVAEMVRAILAQPAGAAAQEALTRARRLGSRFVEQSQGGINEAISCALETPLPRAERRPG